MYNPTSETELEPLNSPQAMMMHSESSPISPQLQQLLASGGGSISAVLSPTDSTTAGSPHCRYCLGRNQSLNYSEDRESLIGPCRCKGTVGLVHPGCLTRWLQMSRKHRCELCGFDLRQCEMLSFASSEEESTSTDGVAAVAAAAGGHEAGARTQVQVQGTRVAAREVGQPIPTGWLQWLKRPEQACCAAMTSCCFLFVSPLIGVLIYFVSELRRQADNSTPGTQDYQIVLFELLTGFVTVAVLVWLIYGSITCLARYRVWRMALRRHREATAIVSLGEETV